MAYNAGHHEHSILVTYLRLIFLLDMVHFGKHHAKLSLQCISQQLRIALRKEEEPRVPCRRAIREVRNPSLTEINAL
jgi:hypothetical protein